MRVLVCVYACSPAGSAEAFGGGELVLGWNLVKQLGRFHEVVALTSARNRCAIERELATEPMSTVRFVFFDLPRGLDFLRMLQGGIQIYAYLWQVKAYFVARRLHRKGAFDLFHHITYANDWMASFIGALLPVPYVRGPGGGAHRTPRALLPEYPPSGRIWELFRRAGQWLCRHDPFFLIGRRRARAILVCNREALEAIPAKLRAKASLFSVNGISSDDLRRPQEAARTIGTFRVISAGKLLRIKGFALALRAFRQFTERHPEAEFILVGDGPELPRLRRLARELHIEHCVHFVAWMPRPQLLAALHACDVFLFASLRDGGGAVVVEAMAAGKPVVCLDIAGPGVHVTPECGFKVAPQSPEATVQALAQALHRLAEDAELRKRMGCAARERAARCYHWDHHGERLRELYEAVLSQVCRGTSLEPSGSRRENETLTGVADGCSGSH